MSSSETGSNVAGCSLSTKRTVDGDGDAERQPAKRRKTDQPERLAISRELAPRPPHLKVKPASLPLSLKTTSPSGAKRTSSLNLKNYPSNHHPVGIAIWILQKVEQVRRDLETRQAASYNSKGPGLSSPTLSSAAGSAPGCAGGSQWLDPSLSNFVNIAPAQEQEAERLQAQRNRKTKQRQENWAKNKETDVVARAKIEAKKHFEAFNQATDADQQVWIEEKVRLDFGRLLDRLAAQLNCDIVGIPPYQIGYADYYFNRANTPQLANIDEDTILAARLIAYVLPALTESVVGHRHQYAADTLVYAISHNSPQQEAFFAAIHMLAQDVQVLAGLDKLMANLFTPKTGPQLARKRTSNAMDQSASGGVGASPQAVAPNATIWHWKEPATIANSTRYSLPLTKAPGTTSGDTPDTVVLPYYQDPLPPPVLVQAEVFRPPPPPRPIFYQYPYQHPPPQTPTHLYQPQPIPAPANLSRGVNYVIHGSNTSITSQNPSHCPSQAVSQLVQWSDSALGAPSFHETNALHGSTQGNNGLQSDQQSNMTPSSVSHQTTVDEVAIEKRHSPTLGVITVTHGGDELSQRQAAVETAMSPSVEEGNRRRSSRGKVLTSKAKAAGILLGTQADNLDEGNSGKISKPSKRRKSSTSPEHESEKSQASTSNETRFSYDTDSKEDTTSVISSVTTSKASTSAGTVADDFVPRLSGRERKPSAKILASSPMRPGLQINDYSNSVPRVSSKLRLSTSSQSSAPSDRSAIQNYTSLSPSGESQTSPDDTVVQESRRTKSNPAIKLGIKSSQVEASMSQEIRLAGADTAGADSSEDDGDIVFSTSAKFLTNNNGQSMSQALLQMAEVAADWSDSDDEDGKESEKVFHKKLQQAVAEQTRKSKQLTEKKTNQASRSARVISQPPLGDSALGHDGIAAGSFTYESNNIPMLRSNASSHHQPTLVPSLGRPRIVHASYGKQNSPLLQSMVFSRPDPRSSAQITDDWLSVVRLKDDAMSRGLPISDSMGLDQLSSLLRAHEAGELNVASNKPGMRTLAPSAARPATTSPIPPSENAVAIGNANGYNKGTYNILPLQFYSPKAQPEHPHPTSSFALTGSNAAPSPFSKHFQYVTPSVQSPGHDSTIQSLGPPDVKESTASTQTGDPCLRRAPSQHTSRYDFNPQGLNSGPPGGGTIINGPETRTVQAKKRKKSNGPEPPSADGSVDGRRSTTPSTRGPTPSANGDTGSATPRPQAQAQATQMPNFKKGGILVSFGKKLARTAAA